MGFFNRVFICICAKIAPVDLSSVVRYTRNRFYFEENDTQTRLFICTHNKVSNALCIRNVDPD